jgi:polyhydroxybutyrate depolymerase
MSVMRRCLASVSVILALVAGAFAFPSVGPVTAGAAAGSPTANRPYGLKVPEGYDGRHPVPLVVLLHGYTSNGAQQATYFGLPAEADKAGFLLATPDGTRDLLGNRFWNATDACCDFFHTGVDDVAYLDAVIGEISARYPVDPARIYVVGHSNGAFMAHRYACDRATKVAAIVTLAGMTWKDQGHCPAGSPGGPGASPGAAVSVLHVHGRNDTTVGYDGGATPEGAYPGAVETVGDWAAKNGCTGPLAATGRRLDLERTVPGDETVEQAEGGCPAGVGVALWTIEGGGHVPAFTDGWAGAIWSFLAAHPKVSSAS